MAHRAHRRRAADDVRALREGVEGAAAAFERLAETLDAIAGAAWRFGEALRSAAEHAEEGEGEGGGVSDGGGVDPERD